MAYRESQVLGSLERHRDAVPESVRETYEQLVRTGEKRIVFLAAALLRRGETGPGPWGRRLRGLGRMLGRVTSLGGPKRILAMDVAGIRGLELFYSGAWNDHPPEDIGCMIAGFVWELEASRLALIDRAKPLLHS